MRLRSLALVFLGTLSLLPNTSCRSEAPADAIVIKGFDANAQHYNRLRAMLAEDPSVGTIGEDFLFEAHKPFVSVNPSQLGLTEGRLAEYKRLLATVGAERLDRYGDSSVSFLQWGSGFGGNTHHKGIAWLTRQPTSSDHRRYALIRDNWYLFQD